MMCRHCKTTVARVLNLQRKHQGSNQDLKPYFCDERCATLKGIAIADDEHARQTGQRFTEEEKRQVFDNLMDCLTFAFHALRYYSEVEPGKSR